MKVLWRVFLATVHVDRRCSLVSVLELHVRRLVELAVVRSATAWAGARLLHRTDTIGNTNQPTVNRSTFNTCNYDNPFIHPELFFMLSYRLVLYCDICIVSQKYFVLLMAL